ncbi:MAG: class I SAM-dependent methyltransferase [Candidatus Eremiobacteraeota bacterium]|nr:class I SAM-dependent methyltransferase [Candidatus Eremiobacteraeota bacterium]MBC5809110.1 class I SAM-dependent methyltransferase [Candidatus Eremiobacteraeota bacterium]
MLTRQGDRFQGSVTSRLVMAREVDSLVHSHKELARRLGDLETRMNGANKNVQAPVAQALALADSHLGPKAAEGLWFNEPIVLRYDESGRPAWARTSERIIEKAWVLRHLSGLKAGCTILDVGCAESLLSLELASNGFLVTGMDVRPYPLRHPNLRFIQGDVMTVPLERESFDGAILLSTIEHIGLGWYGDEVGDHQAAVMTRIHHLLKPGGLLLVTVPFGRPAVTPLHRIFDSSTLSRLLSQFRLDNLEYGIKVDEKTWLLPAPEQKAAAQGHDAESYAPGAVALAVCAKAPA